MITAANATMGALHSQRIVFSGTLMKRCQLSWRPRFVELVSEPKSSAGHKYSFQLLLYETRKQHLKNLIRLEEVVMLRSNMDCHFQLYLPDSKILQLRTDSTEKQAQWMALLKVGLGRGNIFHVQVNAFENLQHALLYSIQVQLPAHRIGQLDRVLVLGSPINDMAIHAWDFNRVQRFFQLDIGVRMEMCGTCLQSNQERSITFVMDKRFIGDCIKFLCRETHINSHPVNQNGFTVYNVPHYCFYTSDQEKDKNPPPYADRNAPPTVPRRSPKHEYDYPEQPPFPPETVTKVAKEKPKLKKLHSNSESMLQPYFQFPESVWEDYTDSKVNGETGRVQLQSQTMSSSQSVPTLEHMRLAKRDSDETSFPSMHSARRDGEESSLLSSMSSTSSLGESLFLADGNLSGSDTSRVPGVIHSTPTEVTQATSTDVPPRNIPRAKHRTSIPASGLHYYNFQPQFQPRHRDFPMKTIPIPPRGLRNSKDVQPKEEQGSSPHTQSSRPIPPRVHVRERESFSSMNYLSKTAGATSVTRTPKAETPSYGSSIPSASLFPEATSSRSLNTNISQPSVNSSKISLPSNIENSCKSDDEDDEPDYEYMLRYSAKSHDIESTYPFSLIALDLSSSKGKQGTKSLFSQSSRPLSQRSKYDEAGRGFGAMMRTFSDTSLDQSGKESRRNSPFDRRSSLAYSSTTSSTPSYEEDCYVMISPTTSKLSNDRCFSPSYIRDSLLLDKIAEVSGSLESSPKKKLLTHQVGIVSQGTQTTGSESKDGLHKERKLSLTDAGHVVRKDWVISLDELRREHAKIAQQVEQVVQTQVGEKLGLNEIAYLEWRRQEENYAQRGIMNNTNEVFSPTEDERRCSSQDSDESDFLNMQSILRTHSHSDPAPTLSPLSFQQQLHPKVDQVAHWPIPRSSAVVSKPSIPRRKKQSVSPGYVKSISLPRESSKQEHRDSSNSQAKTSQTLPISTRSTSQLSGQSSSPDSEGDLEYVHDFITITSGRGQKPTPMPRTHKSLKTDFDSSQQASMVTWGIFRNLSSSEGNLLEAVGRDNTSSWLDQSISTNDLRPY